MTFDRILDKDTRVVHYVTTRNYPVHVGDGNIDYEEVIETFCGLATGLWWAEDVDLVPTCLACIADHALFVRPDYFLFKTNTGRMSWSG